MERTDENIKTITDLNTVDDLSNENALNQCFIQVPSDTVWNSFGFNGTGFGLIKNNMKVANVAKLDDYDLCWIANEKTYYWSLRLKYRHNIPDLSIAKKWPISCGIIILIFSIFFLLPFSIPALIWFVNTIIEVRSSIVNGILPIAILISLLVLIKVLKRNKYISMFVQRKTGIKEFDKNLRFTSSYDLPANFLDMNKSQRLSQIWKPWLLGVMFSKGCLMILTDERTVSVTTGEKITVLRELISIFDR